MIFVTIIKNIYNNFYNHPFICIILPCIPYIFYYNFIYNTYKNIDYENIDYENIYYEKIEYESNDYKKIEYER